MLDGLPVDQFGIGSGWAIVCVFVLLIALGRLVPKNTHDRELKLANEATERAQHEANEWRTESRIKDQQLLEKDIQLKHMAEVGKTVETVMGSLQSLQRRSEDDT